MEGFTMRRRLYFLLPDIKSTRQVFKELLLARIEERHIHVLAREGMDLGDLPEATILQKSDAIHGVELGLIVGGATGVIAGTTAMLFPPEGLVMGLWIVLVTSLIGAIMGVWVAGMIASDVPNTRLARFAHALKLGKLLMIVDIPKAQVDLISQLVKKHHPEAIARGLEPTVPAFP
jgi:MFS family permease